MKKCDEELFSLKGQRNSNEDDEKQRQNLFGLLRTQVVEQLDMTRELTDDELYASIDEVLMMPQYRKQFSVRVLTQLRQALYGSLSTGHANSAQDMMIRLETMVLMGVELPLAAIRGQIASAIDIVIHLGRLRDRSRKVLSIQEVTGLDEKGNVTLSVLYQFQETGVVDGKITGKLEAVHSLKNCEKLKSAGIVLSS